MASEREARALSERMRKEQAREVEMPSLLSISSQIGGVKRLNLILKADVQGSIEPIKNSLERLEDKEVEVRVIHFGSGTITESDVMLAIASGGIIIGFNTHPEPGAKRLAEAEGVEIRHYNVIYNVIDDMEKALAGILEPPYVEVIEGHAQVRAVFDVRQGKIAGVYVTDGKLTRSTPARILRNGQTVYESNISSLRHFKEQVVEMPAGFECGVGIEGFSDFHIGDVIETYGRKGK
jgi:translation initiation factor IF-2